MHIQIADFTVLIRHHVYVIWETLNFAGVYLTKSYENDLLSLLQIPNGLVLNDA